MSSAITKQDEVARLMPLFTIQESVQRYNAIVEFARTVMKSNTDYGVIPGTGTKPTLLKPGAEKLCNMFGLVPQFVPLNNIFDFDKGVFYFQYRCELSRDGVLVASGIGSCNSRESKYRYRWITAESKPGKEEANKLKAQGLGRWRKENNTWVWQDRIDNTEPFDLINTIDKMAQKRAFIAATLIATNASEFFTQDLDDIEIIEGQFVEHPIVTPSEELFPIVSDAEKPAQANPTATMALATAMAVKNSKGEPYGSLDNKALAAMANSLLKSLNGNGMDEEERETRQYKLDACRVILASRETAK